MKPILVRCSMVVAGAIITALPAALAQGKDPVHAVVDLGHQFTFYADGRFHTQYLPGQPYVSSWGALVHFDFSNANLLILLGCDWHLQYLPEDVKVISTFLQQGGGVVLLGSAGSEPQNALARQFGCFFERPAKKPLKSTSPLIPAEIAGGGDALNLSETNLWRVLMTDSTGSPVLARRSVGKGSLLAGARGLAGQNPNAKDNINASWWQPLLVELASGEEAFRDLETKHYDLLITDNRMAGMSGVDLAVATKARWPALPIVMYAGFTPSEPTPAFDLLLLKGHDTPSLLQMVQQLLQHRPA